MVPLVFSGIGVESTIKQVGGKTEDRLRLEQMGFVTGAAVTVMSEFSGNIIIKVKDSKVALSKDMAVKILV